MEKEKADALEMATQTPQKRKTQEKTKERKSEIILSLTAILLKSNFFNFLWD